MPDTKAQTLTYQLDAQIGYQLRLANQKHLEVFARLLPEVTPTQFAVLARLAEIGEVSQNQLGRLIHMDAATTKGVISRLAKKGFVASKASPTDRRRLLISLTESGRDFTRNAIGNAQQISRETLVNLTEGEAALLTELLDKL